MRNNTKNQKAFTLIDILVSAAIVSFLSSIVLFNVSEGRVRAQDAKMKVESGQIATAIEIFKTSNGGLTPIRVKAQYFQPQGIELGRMYQEGTSEYNSIMNELIADGYISKIPTSPDGQSYAYGESTDGTQAVFVAQLKSDSTRSNNTRNSCDVVEPTVTEQVACEQGFIPIAVPSPSYDECTYKAPVFTSEDLPGPDSTITITEPASWDCSNISFLDDPNMSCWESGEASPFSYPCDTQGYVVTFPDEGPYPKFNCPAPESAKAYSCVGDYDNPPPCDSVSVQPGFACENISETVYEVCPVDQGEDENLCDGSSNSDYCTCI